MPEWLAEILAGPTTTVPLAGKALGLSRNASYEAAARGEIKVLNFGRRMVVPTAWLKKLLQLDSSEAP
ncbi:MAG: DNA-binding protein [Alphaproteobacteria bacterium]|nr:DNA-binding protein [Pseudomonadota bacterium]MCH8918577.1 DNA-binding protein [Pseudomonadota bacterium]TDI67088.1 MAG: DNA-binding protein [Alphaproteobacteria bacterium]